MLAFKPALHGYLSRQSLLCMANAALYQTLSMHDTLPAHFIHDLSFANFGPQFVHLGVANDWDVSIRCWIAYLSLCLSLRGFIFFRTFLWTVTVEFRA